MTVKRNHYVAVAPKKHNMHQMLLSHDDEISFVLQKHIHEFCNDTQQNFLLLTIKAIFWNHSFVFLLISLWNQLTKHIEKIM